MTAAGEHFVSESGGTPSAVGRFVELATVTPVELLPGLEFQPVLGQNTMVSFVRFAHDTIAPRHTHEEEQIAIVLDGALQFELDGQVRTLRPGDLVVIPPFVPHGAWTTDSSCFEVDVFNPPRKTLIEHASQTSLEAGATSVDEDHEQERRGGDTASSPPSESTDDR